MNSENGRQEIAIALVHEHLRLSNEGKVEQALAQFIRKSPGWDDIARRHVEVLKHLAPLTDVTIEPFFTSSPKQSERRGRVSVHVRVSQSDDGARSSAFQACCGSRIRVWARTACLDTTQHHHSCRQASCARSRRQFIVTSCGHAVTPDSFTRFQSNRLAVATLAA